jgi:hypothetical protein
MRFAILSAAAVLLAAPAFAQEAPKAPVLPAPPEGFYNDIPGAYDLLLRMPDNSNITLVNGRRICPALRANPTDKDLRAQRACRTTESIGAPAPRAQPGKQANDAPRPVEVYSIDDLKGAKPPSVREFLDSLRQANE